MHCIYIHKLFSSDSRPEFTLTVEPPAGDPEFLVAEINLPGVVRHNHIFSHYLH